MLEPKYQCRSRPDCHSQPAKGRPTTGNPVINSSNKTVLSNVNRRGDMLRALKRMRCIIWLTFLVRICASSSIAVAMNISRKRWRADIYGCTDLYQLEETPIDKR